MSVKKIAVIVKSRSAADFLGSFFQNKKIYKPFYFQDAWAFLEYLMKHKPAAILVEDSFLPLIDDKTTRYPLIAIITGKLEKGLDRAITHHVDRYMYAPYFEKDLAYKLERIIIERNEFDSLKRELWELETGAEICRLISMTLDPKELL